MENQLYQDILALMRQEILPAIGCTEPIAVALCVAKAKAALHINEANYIEQIIVRLSPNVYKNALSVGIPNTGMIGLPIAIALGATIGRPDKDLEVLCDTDKEAVEAAKAFMQQVPIKIEVDKATPHKLFIQANIYTPDSVATAEITDNHTHLSRLEVQQRTGIKTAEIGNNPITSNTPKIEQSSQSISLTFRTIYDFAQAVNVQDLDFLREAARLNLEAANVSFQHDCGHCLGKLLHEGVGQNILGDTIFTKILAYTSGACDARMSGEMIPVMSNTGSGNQGISATVPVVVYGRETGANEEDILRALCCSHLTVIYIKQSLGRLSALCGCVVAAIGAACGITQLMGGGYEEMTFAIKNMIANITGMICDGAKPGCALKVTSGVATAVLSAVLAMQHAHTTSAEGIIDEDVDQSIRNMTLIGTAGMQQTDNVILNIMMNKQ